MRNRSRRHRRRSIRDKFIFTNDIKMINPYAGYDFCIEHFISRFGPNDVILYNKNTGFALIHHKDFRPIIIPDDPYCLDCIYINDNQRGKGQGRRLMKFNLNHFQIVIHTLDFSLGFFELISKDLGLEKINTGLPFGKSFISPNLNNICLTKGNTCLGVCGLKLSGYKRYVCPKCYMRFVQENLDMVLIRRNDSLRSNLRKHYQSCLIAQLTGEHFFEILISNAHQDYKKSVLMGLLSENI